MKFIKKIFKVIFGRTTIALIALCFQLAILYVSYKFYQEYIGYIFTGFVVLSACIVIYIINAKQNPAFKLAWIIPVLVFPFFGVVMYLFVKMQQAPKRINKKIKKISDEMDKNLEQNESILAELKNENCDVHNLAYYMHNAGNFPVYKNTDIEYFPVGEVKFKKLIEELKKAEKYIFMEYFIIEKSKMWNIILEILEEKVKQGVEVRVMYDGMCSIAMLPWSFPETLKKKGINCKIFSPIVPALSTCQNNRDHRKIVVIDGKVAFTGGVNIGDEYINEYDKYGHWKDTSIMLKGDAVKSFVLMFLQMWNIDEKTLKDYEKYINTEENLTKNSSYVIPYSDNPYDEDNIGEQVYMDIINTAKKYVHIMTPYLILDNEMIMALKYAAKRGVDTVIIMPHVPDKIYAYLLARTYYEELLEAGVKIYEYTPGFVHAKVFISDDDEAVVGTINLDFRSLYLNFECAAYMYRNSAINYIEKDFERTLEECENITLENHKKYSVFKKIIGRVLRLFAPLM